MKRTIKILAIAIATLGVVTTSCSSNRDDEHQTAKYNVTGNWHITAYIDSLGNVADHSKDNYYMEFDKDMSYITNYLDQNVSGKYVYEGSDRVIVSTNVKGKVYYKITKMTGNELELTTYTPDGQDAGETYRLKK
ncbi:hypothetical protein HZP84_08060 [Elizabethkingia anophelis]|uniref:Lipocalin-like domain-containing protein n=2 Tax=Elizabethkingia anophelis TaxID=1117645 RepID=A0AAN5MVD9_9FLAO|nr:MULTISPECIES: hypothetical protein [Elizabethkingia]AKH95230.1 hypothetical protein M876_11695 [Elizabethkingia anophelis FMS-007]AQW91574.1 hypothetical protein BBD28_13345 [Elizabethkingia anophelis]AQX00297.1 hypothetical protein BBD32_01875 [Elizabethkingia anophelis]EQB90482.1 hypothetical protein C874_15900 [Elizabethkingia anophelis 502]KFC32874.1 hypothetical protein FF18_11900 [Elizabethkingia anophelis]